VRHGTWPYVNLQTGGERRGGYAGILVWWSGQNRLFACHFLERNHGEDGRGDLLFAAGYGACQSWLSLWLAMERGAGSALAATHPRALFSPFLFLPSPNPSRRH
jgi:hypothetical protein